MILLSRGTAILPDDTAGSLHDRLMVLGAALTVETAEGLSSGLLKPIPQKGFATDQLKPAPKIFPADTVIKWEKPATQVHNLIRGLSPYPGATAIMKKDGNMLRIKILGSKLCEDTEASVPGVVQVIEKSRLVVSCGEGCVEITCLIPEGRKRMSAAEFLRGFDPAGWELA